MMLFGADKAKNVALLLARILLSTLFLIFGWEKVMSFSETVASFQHSGLPLPGLATFVAIFMELVVGALIVLGVLTRPLALLLALYTFATALIGHPYWSITGAAQFDSEINFYKNISIIGGLVLLYVTGAGKYAADPKLDLG